MSDPEDEGPDPPPAVLPPSLAGLRLGAHRRALDAVLDPAAPERWPGRGLATAFPLLDHALDGLRDQLYVVAGGSRMGKSTLLLQLAADALRLEPKSRALVLSLDQPVRDLQLRLVAMGGQCALDYLLAPDPQKAERYEKRKRRGLKRLRELDDRLFVLDESEGTVGLERVKELVRDMRGLGEGPILLVIDPLFKLRCKEVPFSAPLDERVGYLAGELKALCLQEGMGVLAGTRLDRGAGRTRPSLSDLEGQSTLLYEAAAVLLLYNDAANDAQSPFLEWEWGTEDLMVPILELHVAKNKMGPFSGRLYYRFYQSFSMFKECSKLETDNFNRMLENLLVHSGDADRQKEVPMPVVEDVSAT